MIHRFGTKTPAEREEEETERLVRPAPKLKPPRHDRRRETVEPDKDPDLDKSDKDLSKNYKVIGGSAERVLQRWAKSAPSKPTKATKAPRPPSQPPKLPGPPKPPSPSSAPPKPPETKKITVRRKSDDKIVEVTKQTLKDQPGDYEPLEKGDQQPPADPAAPDTSGSKKKPGKTKAPKRPTNDKREKLRVRSKSTGLESEITREQLKQRPNDFEIVEFRGKSDRDPYQPNEHGEHRLDESDLHDAVKKPDVPFAARMTPGQPRRPVTQAEIHRAIRDIIRVCPPDAAAALLMTKPPLHPDEVHSMLEGFNAAKSVPADKLDNVVEHAREFYELDPAKVPPPEHVVKAGKTVSPKDLDPKERAEVIRKHQLKTVAMSMAAKHALNTQLTSKGAPGYLANTLSDFVLRSPKIEHEDDRDRRASKLAEQVFYEGLVDEEKKPEPTDAKKPEAERYDTKRRSWPGDGEDEESPQSKYEAELKRQKERLGRHYDEKPASHADVRNILRACKSEAMKRIAVGYFQAQDYRRARDKYLESGAINEKDSPANIVRNLRKAQDFLRQQSKRYKGLTDMDTSEVFKDRVVEKLGVLNPERKNKVQEILDEVDRRDYEKKKREHARVLKRFEKKHKPGDSPPEAPKKPVHYDDHRKSKDELEQDAASAWDSFGSRTVVARYLAANSLSTYSDTCSMDRTAVYWGVDPYPSGEKGPGRYPDWDLPSASDLSESDFTRILKSAREWLASPVLSEDIEGIERDTQVRAALDLAIRTQNYGAAIHPSIYEQLVKRLGGAARGKSGALRTQGNEAMSKPVTLKTEQVDAVLARLDRMASVVQQNYEKWGMKFAAAKGLVNEIDKTADEIERATYGDASLLRRQASVLGFDKEAEVLQRDSDEPYMQTFANPMNPIQVAADEPYMSAYRDDQSSAVHKGKAENGRPLAP